MKKSAILTNHGLYIFTNLNIKIVHLLFSRTLFKKMNKLKSTLGL